MASKAQPVKDRKRDKELTQDPKRLRWRRIGAKLSVRDLAAKSGVSTGTISQLERGLYPAQAATLAALAGGLGCEVTDLMPPEPGIAQGAA